MSKAIFIAVPSSGVVIGGKLTEGFLRHMADLHRQHPDFGFVVPMMQDYQLLPFMPGVQPTWEVWGARCKALMRGVDEIWVLCYPGRDTSAGVNAEVAFAKELGIPVFEFYP